MSAGSIPFRKQMAFRYGAPEQVTPMVRRVVAENPSAFTYHGTNTYIIGHGEVAVIDPGPMIEAHLDALVDALKGETVRAILVTHTHLDHSHLAPALKERTGGALHGALLKPLDDGAQTAEAVHHAFEPDRVLTHGDIVSGDGWTIEAVFTPGHMSNHMLYALAEENIAFSGDHVMGWNTTIVSPPDGNMRDYMRSLETCLARSETTYWPGHGPEIAEPTPFVRAYLGHRRMREREIETCLANGRTTVAAMVAKMYQHLPENMHKAAARSVFAHVEHMVETGRATCDGPVSVDATYRLP